jgi:hypothetical protein
LLDHRERQIRLYHSPHLALWQGSPYLAGVAAEDQGFLEPAAYIGQAFDDALGHLVDQKVDVGVPTCCPLAAFFKETAVEDFRRRFGDQESSEARMAPRDAMK